MLSNAYFLAKFRFDTAENEPAKNLQNFAKFANFADPNPLTLTLGQKFRSDGIAREGDCDPSAAASSSPAVPGGVLRCSRWRDSVRAFLKIGKI